MHNTSLRTFARRAGITAVRIIAIVAAAVGAAVLVFTTAGYTFCTVASGSMEPVIPTGSLVVVNGRDCRPETGDVIVYSIGSTLIIHRVIDVDQETEILHTKGDANPEPDPWDVKFEQIEGTYVMHVAGAGEALMKIRQHPAIVAAAGAAAAVPVYIALSTCGGGGDEEKSRNKRKKENLEGETDVI